MRRKVYTHPERLVRIFSKLPLQDLTDLYSNGYYYTSHEPCDPYACVPGSLCDCVEHYTQTWHAACDMARARMRALRSAAKWNVGWRWRGKTVIRTGGTTGSGGEAYSRGMTMRMRPDTGPDRFSTPMHEEA